MEIKIFFISWVILLTLDFIWIGIIMKNFYAKELSNIAKKERGKLKPNLIVAFIVYLILAFGITIFVIPISRTPLESLKYGALFGLVLYGVYDFTNLSIIKDYSLKLTITDLLWGTFLSGLSSLLIKIISIII